jgi:hypothetical protein
LWIIIILIRTDVRSVIGRGQSSRQLREEPDRKAENIIGPATIVDKYEAYLTGYRSEPRKLLWDIELSIKLADD